MYFYQILIKIIINKNGVQFFWKIVTQANQFINYSFNSNGIFNFDSVNTLILANHDKE